MYSSDERINRKKQSMKLYTEEQLTKYLLDEGIMELSDLANNLIPHIELPSDEEIEKASTDKINIQISSLFESYYNMIKYINNETNKVTRIFDYTTNINFISIEFDTSFPDIIRTIIDKRSYVSSIQ